MLVRVVSRVALLLAGLGLAVILLVTAMGMLAPRAAKAAGAPDGGPAVAVERGVAGDPERPAGQAPSTSPTVALIFAGIILLATLPPVHRVYVYHRSDWL
jgi:hypothetical protein